MSQASKIMTHDMCGVTHTTHNARHHRGNSSIFAIKLLFLDLKLASIVIAKQQGNP